MKALVIIGVIFGALLIFGLAIGSFVVGNYNSFVSQNQSIDGQWANVETNYQRRFDLIPNLVASVKGYLKQEQKVFGDIAEARKHYAGAATPYAKAEAASGLDNALSRLMVIMENYPQLKSDATVQALMDELAGTENRISVERIRYNDLVRIYNTTLKSFPSNIVAMIFNFKERKMFEAVESAATAPTVDLTN